MIGEMIIIGETYRVGGNVHKNRTYHKFPIGSQCTVMELWEIKDGTKWYRVRQPYRDTLVKFGYIKGSDLKPI